MHCTYTSLTINKHLWRSVEMDVSHTCWYRAVPWQSVQQIAVPLCQWILVGQKWEKKLHTNSNYAIAKFLFFLRIYYGFHFLSLRVLRFHVHFMYLLPYSTHPSAVSLGSTACSKKKTATNVSHAVKKNRILAKALINIIYNDVSGCLAKHLSNIFFDIKF